MGEIPLPLAGGPAGVLRKWVDTREVRAILLDAGNTLVFLDFKAIAEAVRECHLPMEAARMERAEYEARRRVDRMYMESSLADADMWQHYFTWMLEAAGVPETLLPEAIERLRQRHSRSSLWRRTHPAIPGALRRIRASRRKLAVISNSDGTLRESLRQLGLLSFFDATFDSAEVGIEKPNSGIFHLALGELQVRADQAIHLGDLEAIDVRGARRSGILPVLVDPYPPPYELDFPVIRSVADLPSELAIPD